MRISWDTGTRFYPEGVSQGVLYPQNSPGVAWNGLISVTEKGDASSNPLYFDGQKYQEDSVLSEFDGTVVAFTYPDEFEQYNGITKGLTAQKRKSFGLCYRDNNKLHIVYNASAAPSSDQYNSLSDTPNPVAFSWDISTVPMDIPAARPTPHLVIVLAQANTAALAELEALLYGDDANDPSLPDPLTVISIFESNTTLRITDNGDGSWTASGPDSVVFMTGTDSFQINWSSAVLIDSDTYTVYSL
ncbi:MAG TPA: hypothetical protein VGI71_23850 [Scandinavium sp.]|jgi:hypothetical protein